MSAILNILFNFFPHHHLFDSFHNWPLRWTQRAPTSIIFMLWLRTWCLKKIFLSTPEILLAVRSLQKVRREEWFFRHPTAVVVRGAIHPSYLRLLCAIHPSSSGPCGATRPFVFKQMAQFERSSSSLVLWDFTRSPPPLKWLT